MHISPPTFFSAQESRTNWTGSGFRKNNSVSRVLVLLTAILTGCSSSYGAGANHTLSLTPTSINFGNQAINTTAQNTVTVTNAGSRSLQIQSIALTGSSAFTLTGWTGQITLQPSQSFQFAVIFKPTSQNNYSATATIYTNASVDPHVNISGAGIASSISISPTAATVQAGHSQQFKAAVANSTNTSVAWTVNGMQGGNSNVGTISSQGLYTAPSSVSSTSSVAVAAVNGTIEADASVTIMPATTAVSVSLSPTSASLSVGQSLQFTPTVSGTTNTAVNWLVSGIAGGNSTVGTISSTGLYTAPASVATSAVTVTAQSAYQPTSSASATVTISQALLSATPSSVNFGSVVVGSTNSQTISLKNAGTANLTVSSVSVSGTGFKTTGASTPLTIAPGNSSTLSVSFAPSSAGSVTGSLSLTSTASASPLMIPLSGAGAAATYLLGASPTSLSFGNVNDGSNSTLAATLTNSGNSNVTISSVTPSGAGFSASGVNSDTTLAPGQKATLSVTFTPITLGSTTGSVSVTSNATNSPATFALSGTGMAQSGLDLTAPNCGISSTAAIVPNASAYTNFTPPVGGTYTDPGGYCTVKRITNHGGQMTPFYSLVQAISTGDTKILGFDGYNAHWWIWDFNGKNVISGSAFEAATSMNGDEPRWDYQDDSVIWVTSGNILKKCTITMGAPGSISCSNWHTFSEYSQGVGFPADSDMNANGWVPMAGQNASGGEVEIFMFQPSTNIKAGVLDLPGCTGASPATTNEPGCIHRLIATPDNGMTIEGGVTGNALWRAPFSGSPVTLDPTADHHSVGYAIDGKTLVAVFEDFSYNTNGGPCLWRPVVVPFTDTSTGNCPLMPNGNTNPPPSFGWHVSYLDYATRPWIAWTMMSNGTGPDHFNSDAGFAAPVAWNQTGGNWYPYQGEVVLTRVDSNVTSIGQATTTVFRLALHHARQDPGGTGNYWSDVFAPISRDGKYVVFGSNSPWAASGCPAGVGNDCSDLFLIGPLF